MNISLNRVFCGLNGSAFILLLFLCLWIAKPLEVYGQNYEGLHDVDVNEDLTRAAGYDRLSKYLIATADPRDQKMQINRQLLDTTVAEMIQKGEAFDLMGRDLARGDFALRDMLVKVFQGFNYPVEQASFLAVRWAGEGANESIRATLKDASRRQGIVHLMSSYSLENSRQWSSALGGLDAIFSGKSPISLSLLGQTILRVRAPGFTQEGVERSMEGIRKGSIDARWNLSRGVTTVLDGKGALARFLIAQPVPSDSWNAAVWKRVMEKIIDNPLLRREYIERLSNVAPLYEELRGVLVQGLKEHGTPFVQGYLSGSVIRGSRYEWVRNAMIKLQPNLKETFEYNVNVNESTAKLIAEELAKKVEKNDAWMNYILWHVTRAGEVSATTVRRAIPAALGSKEDLARSLAIERDIFGDDLFRIIWTMGAYKYYEKGDAEFYTKLERGQIDREALLRFGNVYGMALATNDTAWTTVLSSRKNKAQKLFIQILQATLETEPRVLVMWLSMIQRGDSNLKAAFVEFLIRKGHTKDAVAFDHWISGVREAVSRQEIVGNPEVGNFRMWFSEFLETEKGWNSVHLRLSLDSMLVPFRLRQMLTDVLLRDPKTFWRMYSMLTCATGPSVSTLVPKIEAYAEKTQIPQYLLEEINLRNLPASDAVDPIWEVILGKESPIPKRIMEEVTVSGSSLSDTYRITSLALIAALSEKAVWDRVKPVAYNHLRISDQTPETDVKRALFNQIRQKGSDALPFIQKVSQDPVLFEAWRKRLLSLVRFTAEAPPIADFLLRNPDLQPLWIKAIAQMVAREPEIMKTVLEALIKRNVGDENWSRAMAKARVEVIQLVTSDRVFFEQVISGKNREFKAAFDAALKDKVGVP